MAGMKNLTAEQQGLTDAEIVNARTQEGPDDGRFHKAFVVMARDWDDESGSNDANKLSVLQDALNLGLHPRGDVDYDGSEEHADGKSLYLRYSVDVIPASRDDKAADAATPAKKLNDLGGSTADSN